ncbi:MAG: hypothetical protein O7D86_09860 [Proteobacteria bacterium]|nr:hypothetical protein [Pseudomonadota bacterium]
MAKAIVDSLILVLDRELLDSFLVGHETENPILNIGVEVSDIGNDDTGDWMTRILQSSLFTCISVESIQKIFSKIESIDVRKGDVIINQGDAGDYYYIIQIGRCRVSRKPTPTADIIPFNKSQKEAGDNIPVRSTDVQYQLSQLRQELDIIRDSFQEITQIKEFASELKKSVIDETEKKIKEQRERINFQTENANKLIQQAQKIQNELEDEKCFIYREVEKIRQEQESAMTHIQAEINKRMLEEEKRCRHSIHGRKMKLKR